MQKLNLFLLTSLVLTLAPGFCLASGTCLKVTKRTEHFTESRLPEEFCLDQDKMTLRSSGKSVLVQITQGLYAGDYNAKNLYDDQDQAGLFYFTIPIVGELGLGCERSLHSVLQVQFAMTNPNYGRVVEIIAVQGLYARAADSCHSPVQGYYFLYDKIN